MNTIVLTNQNKINDYQYKLNFNPSIDIKNQGISL